MAPKRMRSRSMVEQPRMNDQSMAQPKASHASPPDNDEHELLSVVTLVNDPDAYERARASLARSHRSDEIQWLPIEADRLGVSATVALNEGIDRSHADWIVCAHQDVRFPDAWWSAAARQIAQWERDAGCRVGVAGLVGVTRGGTFRGSTIDPAGFSRWTPLPDRVLTVDEHVLILRRDSGLRFDPHTPGFHCYGTDLALTARRSGFDVIVVDAPVRHFSTGTIDDTFRRSAAWLLGKWGAEYAHVIPTCAATIARRSVSSVSRRALVHVNRRLSVWRRRLRLDGQPVAPLVPHTPDRQGPAA